MFPRYRLDFSFFFFGIARSFGVKIHVPDMVLLRCQVYIGVEAENAMDVSEAAFARPP